MIISADNTAVGGGSIETYDVIISLYHAGNSTAISRTITVNGVNVISDTISGTYYGMNYDSSVDVQIEDLTFTIRNYATQGDSMNIYLDIILNGSKVKTMSIYISNNTSREYSASFNVFAFI